MAMINSRKSRFGGPMAGGQQSVLGGSTRGMVDPSLLSFISSKLKKSHGGPQGSSHGGSNDAIDALLNS